MVDHCNRERFTELLQASTKGNRWGVDLMNGKHDGDKSIAIVTGIVAVAYSVVVIVGACLTSALK